MPTSQDPTVIVAVLKAMREFTGESITNCQKVLRAANGDPLLAVGHLRTIGLCVHVKGDRLAWQLRQAQSYAWGLEMGSDGKIRHVDVQPSPVEP